MMDTADSDRPQNQHPQGALPRPMRGRARGGAGTRNDAGRFLASRHFQKLGQQQQPGGFAPPAPNSASTSTSTSASRASVPKGTKYSAGYRDRAQDRRATEAADDVVERRVQSLRRAFETGVIDRETFERRREMIVAKGAAGAGGAANGPGLGSASQPVRGLDRALLERARRGDEVLNPDGTLRVEVSRRSDDTEMRDTEYENTESNTANNEDEDGDIDAQLDTLLHQPVAPVTRAPAEKQGHRAEKRTRAEVLAELKAARASAAAAATPAVQLGSKFRKIGPGTKSAGSGGGSGGGRVEEADREEKVEKVDRSNALGWEADEQVRRAATAAAARSDEEDDDDDDIFVGVGAEYDPLGSEIESSDESGDEEDALATKPRVKEEKEKREESTSTSTSRPRGRDGAGASGKRDYFAGLGEDDGVDDIDDERLKAELDPLRAALDPLKDATVLAALKGDPEGGRRKGRRRDEEEEEDESESASGVGHGDEEGDGEDSDAEARRIRRERTKLLSRNSQKGPGLGLGFGTGTDRDRDRDRDRDMDDLDFNFGGSFGADLDDDDDGGGSDGGGGKKGPGGGKEKLSRRERAKRRREKEAKGSVAGLMELVDRRRGKMREERGREV